MRIRRALIASIAFACGLRPESLPGQGVTTAAVQGTVARADGTPIEAAVVQATNTATGQRWQFETRAEGRYFFENVAVGGPYLIEARALGFAPARRSGIRLTLGQRYTADFALQPSVVELAPVVVSGAADPLANAGRTGPVQRVTDSAIARLPNPYLGRDVLELALLSPQASVAPFGNISVGAQNPVYNSYQIDGGLNGNLYSGTVAGMGFLPFPISQEAVQELQVLAAPFDVRQGSFAGGVLSAVTKSGGNTWHGTAFGYLQNQRLVGKDTAGTPSADFATWQYGATLSGPVVRDRLHLFLNADLQHSVTPDNGPFITDTAGGADTLHFGISGGTALRFRDILASAYGVNAGGLGRADRRDPARDLFGKLTAQLGTNDQIELSYHHDYTSGDETPYRAMGWYALTSTVRRGSWSDNVARLIWHTLPRGRWSNELILSYLRTGFEDPVRSPTDIQLEGATGVLEANAINTLDTTPWNGRARTLEITDNVTVGLGRHLLTVGTHNELHHFRDNLFINSGGTWIFSSLDSLALGRAGHFDRNIPGPLQPEGPNVDFRVHQFGLYLQDQWTPTPRLTLTGGLRVDVPFLPDRGVTNPAVVARFGFDTGRLPSGNSLWSPRVGVNYDLRGDGRTYLRGGIGLFSGSPAYRWIANGYRDSGGEQALLSCDGPEVPAFDPLHPPATCATGAGAQPEPRITVFDPGLRFPQNLKLAVGFDRRLPWGLVATVDLLYTQWVHQFYFTDLNLGGPVGVAAGEGGRLLYGTIDSTGGHTPARPDPAFGQVLHVSNRSGDRALSASVQVQRRFAAGSGFTASYTYSRAQDRLSLINFFASLNLAHTPLEGSLADRQLGTAFFEVPHRLVLAGTVDLPFKTQLALFYTGASQAPYTYVVDGDANADGIDENGYINGIIGNDVVYVPRDVAPGGDISLVVTDDAGNLSPAPDSDYARLGAFIQQEGCLRLQRGRLLARNSCRNGWLNLLNARLMKVVPTVRGQSLEIAADLFNVPNFLSGSWGRYHITNEVPELALFRLRGYDAARQRGLYELTLPQRNRIRDFESRWRMQLSLRYSF
jgi:hypothetical protein